MQRVTKKKVSQSDRRVEIYRERERDYTSCKANNNQLVLLGQSLMQLIIPGSIERFSEDRERKSREREREETIPHQLEIEGRDGR